MAQRDDAGADLRGGFEDAPRGSAAAFRAALQAMARPGRIERISGAAPPAPASPAAGALILTLCDGTTGIHLAPSHDTRALRDWITFHTGAPMVAAEAAAFALGTWPALQPVSRFPVGTAEYPDRSATLIVETETLAAVGARLTGPGIRGEAMLDLPEVRPFAENRRRFPLGLDFYFTCDARLAGLPRSTVVTEAR